MSGEGTFGTLKTICNGHTFRVSLYLLLVFSNVQQLE